MARLIERAREWASRHVDRSRHNSKEAFLRVALADEPGEIGTDPLDRAAWLAEMYGRFGEDFDRLWAAEVLGRLAPESEEDLKRAVRLMDVLLGMGAVGNHRAMPLAKDQLWRWMAQQIFKRGGAWDNGRCRYTSDDGERLKVSLLV